MIGDLIAKQQKHVFLFMYKELFMSWPENKQWFVADLMIDFAKEYPQFQDCFRLIECLVKDKETGDFGEERGVYDNDSKKFRVEQTWRHFRSSKF